MINIHHFNELDQDPAAADGRISRDLAANRGALQKFPNQLAFELDNEPHENATTALMNPIYARAIAEIRQNNPQPDDFRGAGQLGQHRRIEKSGAAAGRQRDRFGALLRSVLFHASGRDLDGPDTQRQPASSFPARPPQPLVPDPSLNLNPWV